MQARKHDPSTTRSDLCELHGKDPSVLTLAPTCAAGAPPARLGTASLPVQRRYGVRSQTASRQDITGMAIWNRWNSVEVASCDPRLVLIACARI